ncbi:hypothetical protein A1F94_004297 [Pyrenophora tritici-repentis]|nr:hypothetical protein A1F94_004297 [Pyrenophora tritici-repentis]
MTKIILLFKRVKEPEWDDMFPDSLWNTGTGLCTSFAICVNINAKTNGTYMRYREKKKKTEKHRAVLKENIETRTTLLIDSAL